MAACEVNSGDSRLRQAERNSPSRSTATGRLPAVKRRRSGSACASLRSIMAGALFSRVYSEVESSTVLRMSLSMRSMLPTKSLLIRSRFRTMGWSVSGTISGK